MAHIVICKYCGEKFDRDKEPFIEVSCRRYSHKACYDKIENAIPQEEKDYEKLEKYIKKLFNTNVINTKIRKQIKDFKKDYNYSYSGMLKTLYWWYEIKGNSIDLAQQGIGIIPFVYKDAEKYFYTIYLAKAVNESMNAYKPEIENIQISSPRAVTSARKLFNIER